MKIGSHVSIKGGLLAAAKEAQSYGANTFMIYTGPPQNARRSSLEEFVAGFKIQEGKEFMAENGIVDFVVHAPYLINLASYKEETFDLGKRLLQIDIERSKALDCEYIVLHPGAYTERDLEYGVQRISDGLNEVLTEDSPMILLETMSGKGTEIGRSFFELKMIMDKVKLKNRLGVCFDTCHTHDFGYDIINDFEGVMKKFDTILGLDKLRVFHINGSLNKSGAKKDRHANIGAKEDNLKGADYIGFEAIHRIVHSKYAQGKNLILETPWLSATKNLYKEEIAALREPLQ